MNFGIKSIGYLNWYFGLKAEKVNITIELYIVGLVLVPNLGLKWQFWFFGRKLPGKGTSGLKRRIDLFACILDRYYIIILCAGADRRNCFLISLLFQIAETVRIRWKWKLDSWPIQGKKTLKIFKSAKFFNLIICLKEDLSQSKTWAYDLKQLIKLRKTGKFYLAASNLIQIKGLLLIPLYTLRCPY